MRRASLRVLLPFLVVIGTIFTHQFQWLPSTQVLARGGTINGGNRLDLGQMISLGSCQAALNPTVLTSASPTSADSVYMAQSYLVPTAEPSEFDGKTRDEIYALRTNAVMQQPQFILGSYSPSASVFGQIVDGQPWWGLEGTYSLGPGVHSISGASEESRMVLNPYLLVAILESRSFITNVREQEIPYPRPSNLKIDLKNRRGAVHYDVLPFYRFIERRKISRHGGQLMLEAYNALDFGFHYLWLDPEESRGVYSYNASGRAVLIRQFIHGGGNSCGYRGGCNNGSPFQRELLVSINELPARAVLKLWQSEPISPEAEPDFCFIIDFLGTKGENLNPGGNRVLIDDAVKF